MNLSLEELKELIGDREIKVKFSNYYKYSFSFKGFYKIPDEMGKVYEYKFETSKGGDPDDIYYVEVSADEEFDFFDGPFSHRWVFRRDPNDENAEWEKIYYAGSWW